jgi:hypothetical protein
MAMTPSTHGYVPGGRWERILRLIRSRPLTRAEIHHALHDGAQPPSIERRKIHFALSEMMRRDLIAWMPFGFVATAQGALELDRGDASFLSASHSQTPFSSSVSTVDTPVSSRELPGSFGTATRSPKERHDFAVSTHGCCLDRPAQQEMQG